MDSELINQAREVAAQCLDMENEIIADEDFADLFNALADKIEALEAEVRQQASLHRKRCEEVIRLEAALRDLWAWYQSDVWLEDHPEHREIIEGLE